MKQGQYLKEVIAEFLLAGRITEDNAENFLVELAKEIKVEITGILHNTLPPGFDILCSLKESCLYLGYWPEHNYVRVIVSSCSNFDAQIISGVIVKYFNIKNTVRLTVNSDQSIEQKVEELWG